MSASEAPIGPAKVVGTSNPWQPPEAVLARFLDFHADGRGVLTRYHMHRATALVSAGAETKETMMSPTIARVLSSSIPVRRIWTWR